MIGLTSFFLINFSSSRVGTLKAAFKAYSFNKTSDLFLFIVIIVIFNTTFSLDILTFLNEIHLYENYTIYLINNNFNYNLYIYIHFHILDMNL
jgi:NADH:ubiquinone oxidoreductase subunit 5 (subunit L)/multisubunit Na+/H+ antiporter MnhA subunit